MKKLLMITGLGAAEALAQGKKGALYYTLEEFHAYWERIDIVLPKVQNQKITSLFGNVHIHTSPWPLLFHPIFFIKKILALHRAVYFDIMTVHEFPPFYNGIGARILSSMTHIPYVLEVMHIPGDPRAASFKEVIYRGAFGLVAGWDAKRAQAVRVINQHQTRDFLIAAGVPKSKIVYIPAFYIDLDLFKPASVEKKYDLIYVARLEKNKGILNLINAVEIIKKNKPDISLFIVGGGPLLDELKSKIKNQKLESNIVFSGWVEDLADIAAAYQSARVFVNPSLNEGGPRVALEAMACGIPVVTTRVGVMIDIIEDGKNGVWCDWEAASMATSIERTLNDTSLQERCSEEGLKSILPFERKAAIKNYAQEIQKIL